MSTHELVMFTFSLIAPEHLEANQPRPDGRRKLSSVARSPSRPMFSGRRRSSALDLDSACPRRRYGNINHLISHDHTRSSNGRRKSCCPLVLLIDLTLRVSRFQSTYSYPLPMYKSFLFVSIYSKDLHVSCWHRTCMCILSKMIVYFLNLLFGSRSFSDCMCVLASCTDYLP